MALKTLVKIGNVNNLSDARYCAGMGVEFLGFNLLENTSNYIDESQFKAITGWVAGIKTVGEFGTADSGYILNMAGQYAVDYIQTSRIDLVGELSKQSWPIILEIEYNPNLILENLPAIFDLSYSKCHYILLSNHGPHQMQPIPEKGHPTNKHKKNYP